MDDWVGEDVSCLYLPYQEPPYLVIAPQVWDHLNIEQVFAIGDAG